MLVSALELNGKPFELEGVTKRDRADARVRQ
jgi:hypothetical protein